MRRLLTASLLVITLSACVSASDETVGVSDICPVHHVKMARKKVDAVLSAPHDTATPLPAIVTAYLNTRPILFPFDGSMRPGGDVLPLKPSVIYVCPECAKVSAAWWKANQANQQSSEPTSAPVTPPAGQESRPR